MRTFHQSVALFRSMTPQDSDFGFDGARNLAMGMRPLYDLGAEQHGVPVTFGEKGAKALLQAQPSEYMAMTAELKADTKERVECVPIVGQILIKFQPVKDDFFLCIYNAHVLPPPVP